MGCIGREAGQRALDVGIHQQRQIKGHDSEGNEVAIAQVKVNEQTDTETRNINLAARHPKKFSPNTCSDPLTMTRMPRLTRH